MSTLPSLDVEKEVLPHFPALKQYPDFCFADNAGGSQILQTSIDLISDYLLKSNVQLGGGYPRSVEAGERVASAAKATRILTNVEGEDKQVVFGSSTTQLATNLAHACESQGVSGTGGIFELGDEIVVTAADHEANVGPWIRLAKALNLTVKYWLPTPISPENPFSLHLDPAELAPLIGGHTRLVAFTAKSNLLGHATKVKKAVDLVKEKTGGRGITVVDCVAYSPHDRMDMNKWGCDAVLFSHYKLFGPHLSSLVISPSSPLSSPSIGSLGHYFHPTSPAYKLAPGGAPYELQIGCSAVLPYLTSLGSVGPDDPETLSEPELVSRAYQRIKAHEKKLSAILLDYLTSEKAKAQGVVVVGPESPEGRAPTISFMVVKKNEAGKYVKAMQSQDIAKVFDEEKKIGIKYGHFYATRILPCLPLEQDHPVPSQGFAADKGEFWTPPPESDGVVRISLVHYNTIDEVKDIVSVLRRVIG